MRKIKLCFKYFITIGLIPILITIFLTSSFYSKGLFILIPLFFSKLVAFAVIWLLQWLNYRHDENLYFYYNNGISKIQLYAMAIIFDFLIMFILILPSLWQF